MGSRNILDTPIKNLLLSVNSHKISCPYPRSDATILCKISTSAITYVNNISFTPLHSQNVSALEGPSSGTVNILMS